MMTGAYPYSSLAYGDPSEYDDYFSNVVAVNDARVDADRCVLFGR